MTSYTVPTSVVDVLGVTHYLPGHANFVLSDTFVCDVTADSDTLTNIRDADGDPLVPAAGWVGGILMFTDETTVGNPPYPRALTFPVPAVRSVTGTTVRLLSKARYTVSDWHVTFFADVTDPLHAWLAASTTDGTEGAPNTIQFRGPDLQYPVEYGLQVGSVSNGPSQHPKVVDATGATVWDRMVIHYRHDLDVDLNGSVLTQKNNVANGNKYVWITADATAGSAVLTGVALTSNPQNANLADIGSWAVGQKIINPVFGPWDDLTAGNDKVTRIKPTVVTVDVPGNQIDMSLPAAFTMTAVTIEVAGVRFTGDSTQSDTWFTNLSRAPDPGWAGQAVGAVVNQSLQKSAVNHEIASVGVGTLTLKSPAQFTGTIALRWLDYEVMQRRGNGFSLLKLIGPGYWPAYSQDPTNAVFGAGITRRINVFSTQPGGGLLGSNGPPTNDAVHAGREPWIGIGLYGVRDILVADLTLTSIWSDFVYTNNVDVKNASGSFVAKFECRNVTLENLDANKCGRQAVTIQSGIDYVIQSCVFRGARHQVFDSEQPWGVQLGVTIRDCDIAVAGYGFMSIAHESFTVTGPRVGTDFATVAASDLVTSASFAFKTHHEGALFLAASVPAGTYVKEYVSPTQVRLSRPATATATGQTATVGYKANWRDLQLVSNRITNGTMVTAIGAGKPDKDGNPCHRTGLLVSGNVNTGGKLYGGAVSSINRRQPLVTVTGWDNVQIVSNVHGFVNRNDTTRPNAGTGYYAGGYKYWPGAPGWSDPITPDVSTSYVATGNRWSGAIDSQLPALRTSAIANAVSPNPVPTTATPVTLTATVTGAFGTPTGLVAWGTGEETLGTSALVAGVATLDLDPDTLPAGIITVSALYLGDDTYDFSEDDDLVIVASAGVTFFGLSGEARLFGDLFGGIGRNFGDYGT